MLCLFLYEGYSQSIGTVLKELRESQYIISKDSLDRYENIIKSVLEERDSIERYITIVGEVHMVRDSTLFFSDIFQRNIISSQLKIHSFFLKNTFDIVGNEGFFTKEQYKQIPTSQLRYQSVARLYTQGKIKNLFPVESQYLYQIHTSAIQERSQRFSVLLTKLRSYIAFSLLLEEMRKKGYTRGALVMGTYHMIDLKDLSIKGVSIETYHTSNTPLEQYF
jgi:hypothetical protein